MYPSRSFGFEAPQRWFPQFKAIALRVGGPAEFTHAVVAKKLRQGQAEVLR
jgi:hypothetical protein